MRIIGIDPGTAITGIGVIEQLGNEYSCIHYSVIRTSSKIELADRLEIIYNELETILKTYKPDESAVEELYFSKNVKTAISVSHARGIILLALRKNNTPIYEYTPKQVKQGITGYGGADKLQVGKVIQLVLNLDKIPSPDDAADALAIAICHGNHRRINILLNKNTKI